MNLPMASGVWSFCHEAEKKFGAHFSPASSCGPALAETFMCLPMTPAGPLKVVTKPILTLSAATAGLHSSATTAAAMYFLICSSPIRVLHRGTGADLVRHLARQPLPVRQIAAEGAV